MNRIISICVALVFASALSGCYYSREKTQYHCGILASDSILTNVSRISCGSNDSCKYQIRVSGKAQIDSLKPIEIILNETCTKFYNKPPLVLNSLYIADTMTCHSNLANHGFVAIVKSGGEPINATVFRYRTKYDFGLME